MAKFDSVLPLGVFVWGVVRRLFGPVSHQRITRPAQRKPRRMRPGVPHAMQTVIVDGALRDAGDKTLSAFAAGPVGGGPEIPALIEGRGKSPFKSRAGCVARIRRGSVQAFTARPSTPRLENRAGAVTAEDRYTLEMTFLAQVCFRVDARREPRGTCSRTLRRRGPLLVGQITRCGKGLLWS